MFIYVIAESEIGPCKVGFTLDPRARLQQLQVGNPRRLVLVD